MCTSPVPFRVPLEQLRLRANIPAGLNMVRVCAIVDTLRNSGGQVHNPLLVRRHDNGTDWVVLDGRHRYMAAYGAGVMDLPCVEETA